MKPALFSSLVAIDASFAVYFSTTYVNSALRTVSAATRVELSGLNRTLVLTSTLRVIYKK